MSHTRTARLCCEERRAMQHGGRSNHTPSNVSANLEERTLIRGDPGSVSRRRDCSELQEDRRRPAVTRLCERYGKSESLITQTRCTRLTHLHSQRKRRHSRNELAGSTKQGSARVWDVLSLQRHPRERDVRGRCSPAAAGMVDRVRHDGRGCWRRRRTFQPSHVPHPKSVFSASMGGRLPTEAGPCCAAASASTRTGRELHTNVRGPPYVEQVGIDVILTQSDASGDLTRSAHTGLSWCCAVAAARHACDA